MNTSLQVIKVGGSLLSFHGLGERLRAWLDSSQQPKLLIAGGGALVDAIRCIDASLQLGRETSHWLSVDAMSLTARMIAELLPDVPLVWDLSAVQIPSESTAPRCWILDPARFLRDKEPRCPGAALPTGWNVTSDSIAARVAQVLHAGELVLLKSSLPDGKLRREEAAELGYVDAYFCEASRGVSRIRCVDLRQASLPECWLE